MSLRTIVALPSNGMMTVLQSEYRLFQPVPDLLRRNGASAVHLV